MLSISKKKKNEFQEDRLDKHTTKAFSTNEIEQMQICKIGYIYILRMIDYLMTEINIKPLTRTGYMVINFK